MFQYLAWQVRVRRVWSGLIILPWPDDTSPPGTSVCTDTVGVVASDIMPWALLEPIQPHIYTTGPTDQTPSVGSPPNCSDTCIETTQDARQTAARGERVQYEEIYGPSVNHDA